MIAGGGGNVGIGTDNPDGRLHVHKNSAGAVSAISQSNLIIENNSANAISMLTPNNTSSFLVFGDTDNNQIGYIAYDHATDNMHFRTAGTNRIAFDPAGQILISGNPVITGLSSTLIGETGKLAHLSAVDADDVIVSNLEVDNFKAATIVTSSEGIASNNNDTTIPTSAAVKAYADSAGGGGGGSVGTLEQVTTAGATTTKALKSQLISITGGGTTSPVGVNGLHLMFDSSAGTAHINAQHNGTSNRHLSFKAASYSFNNGNATFAGTVSASSFHQTDQTTSSFYAATFDSTVAIGDDLAVDTDALFVDVSANRVGINEDSVDATLHLTNAGGGIVNQKFERAGASAWRLGIPNGQTYFAFDDTNDDLSTAKVVITKTDGYVGIGTNSPGTNAHLEIYKDNPQIVLTDSNEGTDDKTFRFININESLKITARKDGNTANTAGGDIMTLLRDGQVGINDTSPANMLSVSGDASSQTAVAKITRQQASASNNTYTFEVDSSAHTSNMTLGGAMAVDVNAGRAFTINGFGRVGIGTNNPSQTLNVSGGNIRIDHQDPQLMFNDIVGSTYTSSWMYQNNAIKFVWGGGHKFKIDSAGGVTLGQSYSTSQTAPSKGIIAEGRVGLGTTNPVATLHVGDTTNETNGTAIISGTGTSTPAANLYVYGSGNGDVINAVRARNDASIKVTSQGAGAYFRTNSAVSTFNGLDLNTNWFIGQYGYNDLRIVDGTASAGDAAVTVQNSTKYVGIGTTNPDAPLHIKSNTNIQTLRVNSAWNEGVGAVATISTSANGNVLSLQSATTSDSREIFEVKNSNGTVFEVQGDGQVGIGTTDPSNLLSIVSTANNNGFRLDYPATSNTAYPFYIGKADDSKYVRVNANGIALKNNGAESVIKSEGSNNDLNIIGQRNLIFTSNETSEIMRITSAGNVGIGSTNPTTYKLQVAGEIGVGNYMMMKSSATFMGMIGFNRNGNNGAILNNSFGAFQLQNHNGVLNLECYNAGGVIQSEHAFREDGKVGIGLTDPSHSLSVGTIGNANGKKITTYLGGSDEDYSAIGGQRGQANAFCSSEIRFINEDNSAGKGAVAIAAGTNTLSEHLRITSAGNVGIGTTSPATELQVIGHISGSTGLFENAKISNFGDSNYAAFGHENVADNSYAIRQHSNGNTHINAGFSRNIEFRQANSTQGMFTAASDFFVGPSTTNNTFYVDVSEENVGIGTTTPRTSLHVSKAGTTEGGIITIANPNNTDGSYCGIEFINSTFDYPRSAIFAQRTGGAYDAELTFHTSPTNEITGTDYPAATERMRIDHDGKVGIGTNDPDKQLHLSSSEPFLRLEENSSGGEKRLDLFVSNSTGVIGANQSAQTMMFQTVGTTRMTIAAGGSVGINVDAPAGDKLMVQAENNYFAGRFNGSTTAGQSRGLRVRAGYNSSDFPVLIEKGDGTDIFIIDGLGNVGIGTTPSNALDVVGHFSATSKSFLIDHPTKENKKLQYASLEGPENGVYVRGTTDEETIELPDYWLELVHDESITVVLTPIGKKQDLFIIKKSNKLIKIGGVDGSYDYVVYGERKDIDRLEVEPDGN